MRNHIRWVVMGMLIVLSFISYVLRTNFNIAAHFPGHDIEVGAQHVGNEAEYDQHPHDDPAYVVSHYTCP